MPLSMDPFESFPDSLISHIFCHFRPSAKSLRRCEVVCKRWNRISKLVNTFDFFDISQADEPIVWQYLFSNSHIRSLTFNTFTVCMEKSVKSWLQQLQYLSLMIYGNTCVNLSCPKLKALKVDIPDANITICNSPGLEHVVVSFLSEIVFKSPKPRLETGTLLIASDKTLECIQDMSVERLIVHPAEGCKPLKMPELFKHITAVKKLEMTALFFETLEDEVGIHVGDADKCILHLKEIEIRFSVMDKVSIKKLDSFLSSLSLCCSKLEKLFIFYKTAAKGVLNDMLQLQKSNRDVHIMCDEQDATLFDSIEEFDYGLPGHSFNLD